MATDAVRRVGGHGGVENGDEEGAGRDPFPERLAAGFSETPLAPSCQPPEQLPLRIKVRLTSLHESQGAPQAACERP